MPSFDLGKLVAAVEAGIPAVKKLVGDIETDIQDKFVNVQADVQTVADAQAFVAAVEAAVSAS